MERHKQAVSRIASAVRSYYEAGQPFRISHGSTNSTRPRPKSHIIDASELRHVLKVDTSAKTALVEPNVPMDRLVQTTLKYGLMPPVVMEFPGITVGGGYNGTSGESSSFKHGFFNETLNSVEMVLANGEVVTASETERPDLFNGAAGAVGTLGVTTIVELRLQEAATHIDTSYHPVHSVAEAVYTIEKFTHDDSIDYLDGILFSKTLGAIVTGKLTNTPSAKVQTFTNAWDPWFYLHVRDLISQSSNFSSSTSESQPIQESIPLWDYLFRYDRGGFWVGASAFRYFRPFVPFNKYTRWFLDDFLRTRMLYSALHASGESSRYMVQDLAMPFSSAEKFINYTDDTFGIWPLWLCPLRQRTLQTMHPHAADYAASHNLDRKSLRPLLNIGLWGDLGERHAHLDLDGRVALNRDLEQELRTLQGMKWLYAHTYYSESDFWKDFDKEWYDKLRVEYGATKGNLPNVWEKVQVDVEKERMLQNTWGGKLCGISPLGGLWGIWKGIQSGEYLKARKSTWTDIEAQDLGTSESLTR